MTLATAPVLVVDQITFWLTNDFRISDPTGVPLATVVTEQGAVTRLLMGPRDLRVIDEAGQTYLRVTDPPDLGLDTFEITDGNNEPLAKVVKQLALLTTRLRIETFAGEYRLEGSLGSWELVVHGPFGPVAQVSRNYRGVAEALVGLTNYVIQFAPEVTEVDRKVVLGSMIAVDLVLAKKRRAANAAS